MIRPTNPTRAERSKQSPRVVARVATQPHTKRSIELGILLATIVAMIALAAFTATSFGQAPAGESVTITVDGATHQIPSSVIASQSAPPSVRVAFNAGKPAEAATAFLSLVDGSELSATAFIVTKNIATATLNSGAQVSLPTRSLATVRFFSGPQGMLDQWAEILKKEHDSDVLIVRKGDSLDHLDGLIGDVGADKATFKIVDSDEVSVNRAKIGGLVYFHPAQADLPNATSAVVLVGGSRILARKIETTLDVVKVETPSSVKLELPYDQIASIDFSLGKLVYLSDLIPETVAVKGYFEQGNEPAELLRSLQPQFDQAQEGGPIRLGGVDYSKGLSLRSRTEISYRIPAKTKRFAAIAGIDDRVREFGNVRLTITGDGKSLFDGVISGQNEPTPLDLNVEGVRKLTILVDYGDDQDTADHLDLADARVTQ